MLIPRQSLVRGIFLQHRRPSNLTISATPLTGGFAEALSLGVKGVPLLVSPFLKIAVLVATVYFLEIRTKVDPSSLARRQTYMALKEHEADKTSLLKKALPLGLTTAAIVCFLGGKRISGPGSISMNLIGKSFGFWFAEAALDSSLDEGKESKPYFTIALTTVLQLSLIFQLVTCIGGGHIVFAFKACGTLLSTTLAGTIDNWNWAIIAAGAAAILATCFMSGLFPAIPEGVKLIGVVMYLVTTIGSSIAYQLSQNVSFTVAGNILRLRYVAHVLSIGLGTPVAWALYDLCNNLMFLTSKVLLDKIALLGLRRNRESDGVQSIAVM